MICEDIAIRPCHVCTLIGKGQDLVELSKNNKRTKAEVLGYGEEREF